MTSEIDSTLTAIISRLLPGSIVDTPSIMKLLEPPPVEGESPARLPLTTPGVRLMRSAKLRVAIGRLVTSAVVTDERALAGGRLNLRRFTLDDDRLGCAAHFERERADRDARARAHRDSGALGGLERFERDLDGVGVGSDVREHEIATRVRHDRRGPGAACLADQGNGRAGNDAALRILDGAEHSARVHLRRRTACQRSAERHRR